MTVSEQLITVGIAAVVTLVIRALPFWVCLLYTSDAADD